MNLALMPIEAVFWLGFALPLPWLIAAARTLLIIATWGSHETPRRRDQPAPD